MEQTGLANLANYDQEPESHRIISEALDNLIRALGIINGSVKVYVHQGKWGPRLEIQQQVSTAIVTASKAR